MCSTQELGKDAVNAILGRFTKPGHLVLNANDVNAVTAIQCLMLNRACLSTDAEEVYARRGKELFHEYVASHMEELKERGKLARNATPFKDLSATEERIGVVGTHGSRIYPPVRQNFFINMPFLYFTYTRGGYVLLAARHV